MKSLISLALLITILPGTVVADDCSIAVLLPLTGPVAEYGVATQNALRLQMDEAPAGAVHPKYSFADNKFEAAEAVSAYRQLGKVDLVYNWGEPTTGAIAPLAAQSGQPLLAMSVDARPSIGRTNIIRTLNASAQFVEKGLAHLRGRHLKKFVVFMTSDPFFEDQLTHLKAQLDAAKGEEIVKVYAFEPETTDFRSAVTGARTLKFDAVFVYLFPGQASTLAKQLRAQKLTSPIIGTDIFESKTEIEQAEGALDGAVYVSLLVPDEFRAAYVKQFGNDLQIAYAYNAYKMGKVLTKACSEPHGSHEQMLNALKRHASAAPDLALASDSQHGQYYRSTLVLRRIEGSQIVTVE